MLVVETLDVCSGLMDVQQTHMVVQDPEMLHGLDSDIHHGKMVENS